MLIHYAVGKLCWERVTISVGPVYKVYCVTDIPWSWRGVLECCWAGYGT